MHHFMHQSFVRRPCTSNWIKYLTQVILMIERISLRLVLVLGIVIMAAIGESRSPTILATLEEMGNTTLDADAVGEPQYRSRGNHNTRPPGRPIAESAVAVFPKPKRAKFEPRRRQQVANVRKKGACMRCRIKKLPVGAGAYFWSKGLRLITIPVLWIISMRFLPT